MSSKYARDPRVPPVHVEHLGRRRHSPSSDADGHAETQPDGQGDDIEPKYDDFLAHTDRGVDLQGETG